MDDITVDQFRQLFPKFSDPVQYPDATIQKYIDLCAVQFNHCIWGDKLVFGEGLWVAHWLTVYESGNGTAVTGMSQYAISKKVGDTSVSYPESIAKEMFANPYMSTPYGREYWFMLHHLPGIGLMVV